MGETQGQTPRLNVFIHSLRTGGRGAKEGGGEFRHETELEVALCLDLLGVSQARHSDTSSRSSRKNVSLPEILIITCDLVPRVQFSLRCVQF